MVGRTETLAAAATATAAAALALAALSAAGTVGTRAVSGSVTTYCWAAAVGCELLFFLHLRRLHRHLDRITPPPRVYVWGTWASAARIGLP